MALELANGVPDYRGSLIPNLYTKYMIKVYYDSDPLPKITNSNGVGELKTMGDRVTFRIDPDFAVNDYAKGAGVTYPEKEVTTLDLVVDKSYSLTFKTHDYTKVQTDIKNYAQEWARNGNDAMATKVGKDFFTNMIAEVPAANTGNTAGAVSSQFDLGSLATPIELTTSNVMRTLLRAETVLREQNAKQMDRWMVVPPSFALELRDSDLRQADKMGDSKSVIREAAGYIGSIAGFHIIQSNWLPRSGATQYAFFGQKEAIAFAMQYQKAEWLRDKEDAYDYYRTFSLCGYKAIKPEALGCIIFNTPNA